MFRSSSTTGDSAAAMGSVKNVSGTSFANLSSVASVASQDGEATYKQYVDLWQGEWSWSTFFAVKDEL